MKNKYLKIDWRNYDSFLDGKTYMEPELWVEYRLGYKWQPASSFISMFSVVWLQQDWPDLYKSHIDFVKGSVIFVPQ